MFKSLLWPVFILVILAQWLIPGQMIWHKEKVLKEGSVYKFQSAPVDPSDPFRGKFVVLNFKENHLTVAGKSELSGGQKVYVHFFNDKNGFANIKSVTKTKPAGKDYLETTVNFISSKKDSVEIYLDYPFSNYYMDEFKAPRAESIYREVVVDSSQRTYALISLLDGEAVIKDVYINDTLIQQVINQRNIVR